MSYSLLPNASISTPFEGRSEASSMSFSTPYFVADINILDSVCRAGAYYQPNTTSLIPIPFVSQVNSSVAADEDDVSSTSNANDPTATKLAESMSQDSMAPVINTFEGSMVLLNGNTVYTTRQDCSVFLMMCPSIVCCV